ncbi:MAG TPA: glycosyltransferase family 2 protein [Thermoanaerobaculia bacterium]|nr:glycosyltransferase family 2 protein [Thermoanaerobaculia bacterium]
MRIAAVVPAYNEQETLAAVLAVLKSSPLIQEVLVVSDGSTDSTVEIARAEGVKVIHLRENCGKGTAMAVGVAHTDAPVLVFVDGDILNLSEQMLAELIRPVVSGRADMNVGVRHRGRAMNALQRRFGPLLSGIRCLRREVFEAVPEDHLTGFAIETGLNWAARQLGARLATTVLHGLKHLVKEKKRGLARGSGARVQMFWSVFAAWLSLHWKQPGLRTPGLAHLARPELDYINF